MAQLLMALKEHEIPIRGLYGGKVYEMVDKWKCKCGKQSLVSVLKAKGRVRQISCAGCLDKAPKPPTGWFKSYRFVPLNDPDFKGDDIPMEIPTLSIGGG